MSRNPFKDFEKTALEVGTLDDLATDLAKYTLKTAQGYFSDVDEYETGHESKYLVTPEGAVFQLWGSTAHDSGFEQTRYSEYFSVRPGFPKDLRSAIQQGWLRLDMTPQGFFAEINGNEDTLVRVRAIAKETLHKGGLGTHAAVVEYRQPNYAFASIFDGTLEGLAVFGEPTARGLLGRGGPEAPWTEGFSVYENPALAEVLPTLGASPEVIEFVLAQDDPKLKGLLLNAVKKFPGISVEELEQIAPPKKRVPLEQEINWVNQWPVTSGAFKAWLLVQLMKHRYEALPTYSPHKGYTYVLPGIGNVGNGDYEDSYFVLFTPNADRLIWGLLSQVWDWVSHTNSRIESYSWEEALEASQAWHEACALKGQGEEYEEQNIAYRYPDQWTIQEVRTENDLDVEGNRMGHCVGSYADQVSGGKTRIFSLRDPQNQPHVTIEAGDSKDKQTLFIRQIQGKSNKPPIPEYRARVRDWFQEIGARTSKEWTNERDIEELFEAWLKGEVNALREKGGNVFLDYGLKVPVSDQILQDIYEGISESALSDMDLAERLAGDPPPKIPWSDDSENKEWTEWEQARDEGMDQSIQEFFNAWGTGIPRRGWG